MRPLQPGFDIAEWGFALGGEHWGIGLSMDASSSSTSCSIWSACTGSRRARRSRTAAATALHKLGATREGVPQRSCLRNGIYLDQALWTILADDRRIASAFPPDQLVH